MDIPMPQSWKKKNKNYATHILSLSLTVSVNISRELKLYKELGTFCISFTLVKVDNGLICEKRFQLFTKNEKKNKLKPDQPGVETATKQPATIFCFLNNTVMFPSLSDCFIVLTAWRLDVCTRLKRERLFGNHHCINVI